MKAIKKYVLLIQVLFLLVPACKNKKPEVIYDFNNVNNRVWIGEDFWSVPLEDWQVKNERVECLSGIQNATLTVLPYSLTGKKSSFDVSIRMGLLEKGGAPGSSGLTIGAKDATDEDFRAAIYFGNGINVGINTEGYVFIEQSTKELSGAFDYSDFTLRLNGEKTDEGYEIMLEVYDKNKVLQAKLEQVVKNDVSGIIQLVNNFRDANSKENGPKFWFDDFVISGENISYNPENRFGPILWAMHTLSEKTLKLTAQFPPISDKDNQEALFFIQTEKGEWQNIATKIIDQDARCAVFKIEDWDDTRDFNYKVVYNHSTVFGDSKAVEYAGVIKRNPVDKPLKMGALTCQYHTGFPYSPIHKKLKIKDPDILYFSGDQIYEGNGGYPIKRSPDEKAINSYLGKWYMFGWVFGDLMRNVPTICTPDDHDIFQGNLWGGGGELKSDETNGRHDYVGFDQSIRTVNAVNRTQCAHLPDPFDAARIKNGMSAWYTSLNYGRVSFGIVSDRVFKSGPQEVANWEGRLEQIRDSVIKPSDLEKPGLEFLGERQEDFLENWIRDWNNVDMKVLLSQTVFANATTHYGTFDQAWYGDMDSGGWPKKARDKAIEIVRKGFAFHITGDQHLPSLLQYGIDDYRDAGWCFCTPAISICYSRWFRPDDLNRKVENRPEHGLPNTGNYRDFFGNYNYVYAVGYPGNYIKVPNRYEFENSKTSGFGFVTFNQQSRDITVESWKMLGDNNPDEMSQHPGWPHTINQFDNYGRKAVAWLPTLKIKGEPNPVVEIINQKTNDLVYMVRIRGNEFEPKVFSDGKYKIRLGYPESNNWKEIVDINSKSKSETEFIEINIDRKK